MQHLLIIGHTIPEPTTTAAGTRMLQLISLFKEAGYTITFGSTAAIGEYSQNLDILGVSWQPLELNSDSFNQFIEELNPSVVLFDRYITEEQFGWRVAEVCPSALRILDTEDLHFLRKARQEAFKKSISISNSNLYTETAKRELASILRCDLSLIISEVELTLLKDNFKIPEALLYYLPFLVDTTTLSKTPSFDERKDFMCIGNFLHAPNEDAVLHLKQDIWPKIRQHLPGARLHVFGGYAKQKIKQLHNEADGFLIKGWAPSVEDVMENTKVNLAPLRYGAGLKGKLLDAMHYGLPSVTTPIGAEGMHGSLPFGGLIATSIYDFVKASVTLYTNKAAWETAKLNGQQILQDRFSKQLFSEDFINRVQQLSETLQEHRNSHFIGQVLQHSTLQSHKYLSKWIEAKNKNK
ncbi:glycosyltransferase [Patiriisocius hiemis]|uniref:Glycosyltransferase n=1 Tax=Patiriisocius hiemis TaxID=3075604 RepID=A0ABU2YC45_9FLAO|nr:glycosyltransferase [Constantimarinum sp. W242]MDT0554608.1 glycosyltransferase [Constantimarinum sp. W242]